MMEQNNNQAEQYASQERISKHLREIEEQHHVKILYAVESGSRAWGFASPDSDWDVRFIYVHEPEWYFHIEEQKDTIEQMFPDETDMSGWDLRKALRLFKSSNPSLFEWLHSPYHLLQGRKVHRRDTANGRPILQQGESHVPL